jgi:signal transduction histidine kinase
MVFRFISAKIQNKLIVIFSIFCLTIFSISGLLHYWYTESSLDEELGKKLLAVAQAATLQVNTELVSKLTPGDEETRTYRNFKKKLSELRDATDVERIYIMNLKGRSMIDTDEGVKINYAYPFLKYNKYEFDRTIKGIPSHTVLFESYDGKLYKTAFVPLVVNNEVMGVIAVDGSATFLYLIKRIEWHLLMVGIIGVLASIIIGFYFARSISNPLKQLMEEAEKIGTGKLDSPIINQSRDEIGFLGETMEKMRRNILKRDQYLKTMLAGVAHELRNPLGGIEIYAHLLNKEILNNDKNKNYTQKIIFEVESMKKILIDFLDFARPNSPQPDVCHITATVEDVRNMLRQQIEKKHITIQMDIQDDRLVIDPAHFRQIITNIIENSIQSIETDKGQITIKSKLTDDQIQINISDNGAGIEEAIKDKIFDPFFTTKEKGSGLGLAIVKKLVDENNGDIMIISNPPKGSDCQLVFYKQSNGTQ